MEDKVNDRVNALLNYQQGQESIANDKVLSAIGYYRQSLYFLREVSQAEVTAQDTVDIQNTLSALINALNMLITLSPEVFTGIQVVNELDRFLHLYVSSFNVFNKTEQRLPWLNELNLQQLGELWRALSLRSEKGRCEIYIAIVSLFHEEMTAEKELKIKPGKDAAMDKAFKLYQRALEIAPVPEPELPPVVVPPPRVVASAPAVVSLPPRFGLEKPKTKKSGLAKIDGLAPDEHKRAHIFQLMAVGKYREALDCHYSIINHTASDFRYACMCQRKMGDYGFNKKEFQFAIESYKNALTSCGHILDAEATVEDRTNVVGVFGALVKTVNFIIRNWSANFAQVNEEMRNFLNFYLDKFRVLNTPNKKLPGLDGINMDSLIAFLREPPQGNTGDFIENTRVYIAVIAMFSKNTKLEAGQLISMIDEINIKRERCTEEVLRDAFSLFQHALELIESSAHVETLNPEVKRAVESEKKRRRKEAGTSSSSSFSPYGLGSSPPVTARQDHQDSPPRSSPSFLQK